MAIKISPKCKIIEITTPNDIRHNKRKEIMANCEFLGGMALVSGTLSKKVIHTKDGIIIQRIVAQVGNGKQKIYIREERRPNR